jgi:hypothetical protein
MLESARAFRPLNLTALLIGLLSIDAPRAIERDTFKDIRSRYEGLSFRLRIDLKAAGLAADPNVVSLEGVGHPSERSPILFTSLETVFVQRITNVGGTRLGLTVYRNQEEANRLRASAVPPPTMSNPNYGGTVAAFAQQGSTSVVLELKAGKKDGPAQMDEIESLLDRVFYMKSEPMRQDLEVFVARHSSWPISRLHATTGLPEEDIRTILKSVPGSGAAD